MPINREFVKLLGDDRQRLLDITRREHQTQLDRVLSAIEAETISLAAALPLKDGRLFDAQAAIDFRLSLRNVIGQEIKGFQRDMDPGYTQAVRTILSQQGQLDLPDLLTTAQRDTIRRLKTLHFQGFDDVAQAFQSQMVKQVFDATLLGTRPAVLMQDLSKTIQGVFSLADTEEAAELVEFIKDNREDPSMDVQVADAAKRIHTLGRDILGVNMRSRTNQMVFDSLFQFSAQASAEIAKETGLNHFWYRGAIRKTSRKWCRDHVGDVLTKEEVDGWRDFNWQGKAPGDPMIVRGGYNCRHSFIPVDPDWLKA